MQNTVQKTLTVHGRTYELRKDATDPTQQFPYALMVPLNQGCTKLADGQYCCWVRGVIPPRQGTIEVPMEVVALGFSAFDVPPSAMSLPSTLERMHYYVARDDDFMQLFASQFLGVSANAGSAPAAPAQPVEILPFPKEQAPQVQAMPAQSTPAVTEATHA